MQPRLAPVTVGVAHGAHKGDHRSVLLGVHVVHPCVAWGYTSLKSGALQLQILKSLKRMPWHPFKAPGLQTVKSVKSMVHVGGGITSSRFQRLAGPQNKKYLTSIIPLKGDFIMYTAPVSKKIPP